MRSEKRNYQTKFAASVMKLYCVLPKYEYREILSLGFDRERLRTEWLDQGFAPDSFTIIRLPRRVSRNWPPLNRTPYHYLVLSILKGGEA